MNERDNYYHFVLVKEIKKIVLVSYLHENVLAMEKKTVHLPPACFKYYIKHEEGCSGFPSTEKLKKKRAAEFFNPL